MMDYFMYGLLYALAGLLLGELYLRGCRKVRHEPDMTAYVLGMILWPATLVLWFLGSGRKK
jgi:hypothetical protein